MHDFINRLRILQSLDSHELPGLNDTAQTRFMADPYRFLMRADDATAAAIWAAVERRATRRAAA